MWICELRTFVAQLVTGGYENDQAGEEKLRTYKSPQGQGGLWTYKITPWSQRC